MSVGWQCGRKVLLIFLNCVKPPIQVSGVELRIVTKQKSQYNNTTHYNCHLIQFKYICHRSFSSIACFVNETVRTILQLQSRSHLAAQYTESTSVYISILGSILGILGSILGRAPNTWQRSILSLARQLYLSAGAALGQHSSRPTAQAA